jgi:L-alanine-DL-glutamate epimerase-like enolase superfamily enzyme
LPANSFLFVKVMTDEGIYGIGEGAYWGFLMSTAEAVESFKTYLIGQDPLQMSIIGSICIAATTSGARIYERDQRDRHGFVGHCRQIFRRAGLQAARRPTRKKYACIRR